MTLLLVLLAGSLLAGPAPGRAVQGPAVAEPGGQARPATAGDPFPPVEGWSLVREERVYTPANLWDLIDGAADLYLEYNFVDLTIGEYRRGGGAAVRVELYRHATPPDAFGIYSQERNPEYRFVEAGTEGYAEEGVLNFLSGIYYVKMTTREKVAGDDLLAIGRAVERHLQQGRRWPGPLALLPSEGKLPRSETYVARNFLGYAGLHSAYAARYRRGASFELFVIEGRSAEEAAGMLAAYFAATKHAGSAARPGRHLVADPNNGPVAVVLRGARVCGVVQCADAALREKLLDELEASITRQ